MRCCSYEGHVGCYSFSEHFHREIFREYGRFFARRAGWNVSYMFKIISIMFVGLGAGYLLRDLKLMRKTEKTIPLTVFCYAFYLGDIGRVEQFNRQ